MAEYHREDLSPVVHYFGRDGSACGLYFDRTRSDPEYPGETVSYTLRFANDLLGVDCGRCLRTNDYQEAVRERLNDLAAEASRLRANLDSLDVESRRLRSRIR